MTEVTIAGLIVWRRLLLKYAWNTAAEPFNVTHNERQRETKAVFLLNIHGDRSDSFGLMIRSIDNTQHENTD